MARNRVTNSPVDDESAVAAVTETLGAEEIGVVEVDPKYRREQIAANLPAVVSPDFSEDQLHGIENWADAVALLRASGVEVADVQEEIGDGFDFLENKKALVGRPCLFVKWEVGYSSGYTDKDGQPLRTVQAWVIVGRPDGIRKVRIVDFSTGICQQLWEYTKRTGRAAGLNAPKGLRESTFPYVDPTSGQQTTATTYYIDLSKEL